MKRAVYLQNDLNLICKFRFFSPRESGEGVLRCCFCTVILLIYDICNCKWHLNTWTLHSLNCSHQFLLKEWSLTELWLAFCVVSNNHVSLYAKSGAKLYTEWLLTDFLVINVVLECRTYSLQCEGFYLRADAVVSFFFLGFLSFLLSFLFCSFFLPTCVYIVSMSLACVGVGFLPDILNMF